MSSLFELSAAFSPIDTSERDRLVRLMGQAQQLVEGGPDAQRTAEGPRLATLLERWRYRFLNAHAGYPPAELRSDLAALDFLAHRLRGGPPRMPRQARDALAGPGHAQPEWSRAAVCLDHLIPRAEVESRAQAVTRQNLPAGGGAAGHRVLLYAPLYVSSHCINDCSYCTFRYPQAIERKHLSVPAALEQAGLLRDRGFRHVLLVAGDFPRLTTPEYLSAIIRPLAAAGLTVSVEIAPQSTQDYAELAAAGAYGLTLYQETYGPALYAQYHRRGTKVSYDWRLEGPERAAEAGFRRLGLGVLLGLAPPAEELAALIRHGAYLQARFPDRVLAFSLPRIHEAPGGFRVPHPVDDDLFIRLYCALRLAFPAAELVLSTRESPQLRNHLTPLCITQLSAGSCTAPGGYRSAADGQACPSTAADAEGQFPVHDQRTVDEVTAWLRGAGLTPVWTTC